MLNSLPLNGSKTYLAAAGFIGMAVFGFLLYLTGSESALALEPNRALETLLLGIGTLGIGHKIDKSTE